MQITEATAPYAMSDKDLACGRWLGRSCFLAESQALLEAAVECGLEIYSMLSTPDFGFPDLPSRQKVTVSPDDYELITGYPQTRSVVGVCQRPNQLSLEQLLSNSKRIVVMEDSSNGANMAALFRIAHSFGIDGILITHSCADPLFRRAARMSKGDCLRVPYVRVGSGRIWAPEIVPRLHASGFKLAALALEDDSISLDSLPRPERLALIMGTEGEGLQQETIGLCDWTVKIPMREGVDSLNVAAAAAVACWQATR